MLLFLLLYVVVSLYLFYNSYCLYLNYVKASRLGLPRVISFITPDNPFWIALQTAFKDILRYFPFAAISFTRHCRLGWEFHDRYHTHVRLGDAWILVTPARNWVFVANAKAVTDIFGRGRDFTRPIWMLETLNVFGPNIATAEGSDWQRQRKLTATPFNEQKCSLVWDESLRQATDMLKTWKSNSSHPNGFTTTPDDTRTLALHVLAYVAFQKSYPFDCISRADIKDAKSLTYRDSISIILENVLIIMVLPEKIFFLKFLPHKVQRVGWAIKSFREYMSSQVLAELNLIQNGQPGSGNLISNLVRASDPTNKTRADDNFKLKPLTSAEILGNIFVFNFAGHDTTAISLAYGMLLLVAHPEVQDWVHEELDYYLGDRDLTALTYTVFLKLKRSLAVLLETLRLYNPLPGVPKYTNSNSTEITINNHTYLIPADYLVVPSLQALHTHPRHWGDDSLVWRPSRWIIGSNDLESERLFSPPKGVYFPWSDGIRNCPGKKFAQVEFVATLVALFRNHIVEPVPKSGESLRDARDRTLRVVKDSNVELLLQMRDSRSVSVRWMERPIKY